MLIDIKVRHFKNYLEDGGRELHENKLLIVVLFLVKGHAVSMSKLKLRF